LKGAEPVPNVTVGLSSVATSASEVKKTRKNAIVEYLEQIPVTQLKGQKGPTETFPFPIANNCLEKCVAL